MLLVVRSSGFVLSVVLFVVRAFGRSFWSFFSWFVLLFVLSVVLFVVRALVVLFVVRSSVRAFGRSFCGSFFWFVLLGARMCFLFDALKVLEACVARS